MLNPTEKQLAELRASMDSVHPLGDECWEQLRPLFHIQELKKGELYSSVGQMTKNLGQVQSGILRIFYLNENGKEWNKHFLQKGDFVAASVSPKKKAITSIEALSNTIILRIQYSDLIRFSTEYAELVAFIQKLAFNYLEQKQEREIRLLSEEAMANYEQFKRTFPDLEDLIAHYHIASYLGVTPTQLSRLRKKIEE
jgi:CRP-like cAMP-binding protein